MSTADSKTTTPLMRQYNGIKAKYPDAILLFRVGDFYETFSSDAVTVAQVLGIVLTKRNNGNVDVELAGFPYHALDTYLPKLVRAGHRVAICEQLEDPALAKTIVRRGVTEIITPGITTNDKLLDHKTNNYVAAVYAGNRQWGIAFADVSTGELMAAQGEEAYIEKLLQNFQAAELIYPKNQKKKLTEKWGEQYYMYGVEEWSFGDDFTRETLLKYFQVASLKGFGLEENAHEALNAAGAMLHYIAETQQRPSTHFHTLRRIEQERYVWLDAFTIRNLELIASAHAQGVSLLQSIDRTLTPMGARMLKKWVLLPLKELPPIQQRLELVSFFYENPELSRQIEENLRLLGDLERLSAKAPLRKMNPREALQLKRSLFLMQPIKESCLTAQSAALQRLGEQLNLCVSLRERIEREIQEDAPLQNNKGGIIKDGVSAELDELRNIAASGKEYLLQLQQREIEKSGITSLKIGFNQVFGYYIEITNRFKEQVPPHWIRKQTLANAERFLTEELKEYENKILTAQEKIVPLEIQLFDDLLQGIADYVQPIQHNAQQLARLDCLLSFARLAQTQQYCKPQLDDSLAIDIKAGRHPVIEQTLKTGDVYVPNDVYTDADTQQILIITGPNMSGKSALLRQTALITLLAQMGSFVPAQAAQIGLVDKIFTRVGASDNISLGESTFMVEMNETASIMNNLSERSLILLDEIGRGTSTFDGISIAWSLAEYLHQHPKYRPRTLFATHYHELNELAARWKRIKNFHVATHESDKKVIFLRKLVEGGSEHSFGIQVAKMAGMPLAVVERAHEILAELEAQSLGKELKGKLQQMPAVQQFQMNLFSAAGADDSSIAEWKKAKEKLSGININALTPIEALIHLNELQQLFKKESK